MSGASRTMRRATGAGLVVALAGCARGERAETSIVDSLWGQDSARVALLEAGGSRYTASDVVVWTPGDVDPAYAQALTDSLNEGVIAVKAFVGAPLPWARLGAGAVTYYFPPDTFVSHASGRGAVFISWWRVEGGSAPFKHEALHEVLEPIDQASDSAFESVVSHWLSEGLPDHVAEVVAERTGLREGDVFDLGGTHGVDAVCRERLGGPWGSRILPYIPGRGRPPQLMTTARREVAPAFYACANSFSKYLVGRLGIAPVVSLLSYVDALPPLEEAAGATVEELRRDWLRAIGYGGGG